MGGSPIKSFEIPDANILPECPPMGGIFEISPSIRRPIGKTCAYYLQMRFLYRVLNCRALPTFFWLYWDILAVFRGSPYYEFRSRFTRFCCHLRFTIGRDLRMELHSASWEFKGIPTAETKWRKSAGIEIRNFS